MKTSNFVIGLTVFLIGAAALGAGGYFLYSSISNSDDKPSFDGSTNNNNNNNNSTDNDFELDVTPSKPSEESDSYEILKAQDLRYTYESLSKTSTLEGMLPSHGNPNVLLVPVEFNDLKYKYPWDETSLYQLNGAFNGTKPDHTNDYAESVRSFYNKSSYGSLDINFILTDPFTPSISSNDFAHLEKLENPEAQGTYQILGELREKGTIDGKRINFNDDKYDLNNDDYVDGIWLIYNDKGKSNAEKQKYWPYCFWYSGERVEKGKNYISAYANCSFAFLFEGTNTGQDYHTISHETGHMMGLDDYYSYDLNGTPAALGGLDMMDLNIGEHNAFSKTALGWTNPIIPKKSGTFKLRPFSETGDCIILSKDFNDSAFSEYIMLEYYTPNGLNQLDSSVRYPDRPYYFSVPGLRAYHIDARLIECKVDFTSGDVYPQNYYPSSSNPLPTLSTKNPYYNIVGSNNTRSRSIHPANDLTNKKDLIAAIDADNRFIYNGRRTDNNSLFRVGDKFTPFFYQKYFNGTKFNNGKPIDFTFKVASMNSDELTVEITL